MEEEPSGYDKLKESLLFYYGTEGGGKYKKQTDNEPASYELPETGGFGTAYRCLMDSMFIPVGGAFLLYDRRLAQRRTGR